MSFEGFVNYLQHEKRYSPSTIISYRTDLEQFSDFAGTVTGNTDMSALQTRHVRSWVVHLMNERALSPASVRRKISSLNTYYNYMMKRQGWSFNPASLVTPVKIPKRIPQYVNRSGMEAMISDLERSAEDFSAYRSYLMIEVLYNTGLRRQELIGLKWGDIDFSRKTVKVTGKGSKQRQIPLAEELIARITKYRKFCEEEFGGLPDHIFVTDKGKNLYPKFVYNEVKRNITRYSSLKRRSPHILRHTFATHLLNNGADLNDIKELLGHSSLASTQVYTHNSIEDLKNIYEQAHPRS